MRTGVADLGIGTSRPCSSIPRSLPATCDPASRWLTCGSPFPRQPDALIRHSSSLDVLSSTATDLTKPFALAPPSQERVLKDSEQMIPRTRKSLEDAVLALQDLVVS